MYYYYLLDMFARVPLVTSSSVAMEDVVQSERSAVFNFVRTELEESVEDLSDAHSNLTGEYYGRITKPVAYFLLAKLALNAEVYADDNWTDGTKLDGKNIKFTVDGTEMNAWEATIAYCDKIAGGAIRVIKKHPIADRKLKNVTAEHLQSFFDLLTFGGEYPDGTVKKGYSKDYIHSFSAVLQQAFRFAVFPKQLITFNPMQYIKLKKQAEDVDLFSDDDIEEGVQPISHEDYQRLIKYLEEKNPPAILPIQIAYYAGLRIGEVCGLTWQDINLEEQYLTIKRSTRYDGARHKNIIGPTKRKKVRIVDFGDTLAGILKEARKEQLKNRMQYGELYHRNYYKEVQDKNRVYYEYYHLDGTQDVPEEYKQISFVCLRPDGCLELPSTLGLVCRSVSAKLDGFEGFHFHQLRHTYTSNLLSNGAAPKDVQELLGHSDVSTTMNVYAHSTRKAKRDSARLLDKVAGND